MLVNLCLSKVKGGGGGSDVWKRGGGKEGRRGEERDGGRDAGECEYQLTRAV